MVSLEHRLAKYLLGSLTSPISRTHPLLACTGALAPPHSLAFDPGAGLWLPQPLADKPACTILLRRCGLWERLDQLGLRVHVASNLLFAMAISEVVKVQLNCPRRTKLHKARSPGLSIHPIPPAGERGREVRGATSQRRQMAKCGGWL